MATYVTQMVTDDFVGAPKPPQSKRKLSALQRSSRQRMRRCGSSLTGNLYAYHLSSYKLRVTPNASWTKIVSENRWISVLTGLTAGNHALNRLLKVLKSTMKNCFCNAFHSKIHIIKKHYFWIGLEVVRSTYG